MDPGQTHDPGAEAAYAEFVTAAGVRIARTASRFDPALLTQIAAQVDGRRGGVLSSGMEYPGRYSRWHLAYVDPCVEIVAARAADRGPGAERAGDGAAAGDRRRAAPRGRRSRAGPARSRAAPGRCRSPGEVAVVIPEPDGAFTEEQRSRRPTVFTALREVVAAFASPEQHLGLYGAFGYDLAFQFEAIRPRRPRPDHQRDLVLHLPDETLRAGPQAGDRRPVRLRVRGGRDIHGGAGPADAPGRPRPGGRPARPPSRFRAATRPWWPQARERFARGDLFEVVPSHTFYGRCDSPAGFYERLRHRNPAPYEFFFNLGEGEYLVGASPEMYVRVTGDRVETCPIAGTIARGGDPLGDAENIRTLLTSAKEESELTMCTDVDRNDKSRICVPGSVRVIGRRQIEMYSRVIHTVDHVEGRLRPGLRRAGRVPDPHVGGHGDRRAQGLGHAVHRRPRGRAAAVVRRRGRHDRFRRLA